MTTEDIIRLQDEMDRYTNKVIDCCWAALFLVFMMIAALLGYDGFNS